MRSGHPEEREQGRPRRHRHDRAQALRRSRASPSATPPSSPAASSSAWPSPACLPRARASSCSTSPSPPSTRTSRACSSKTSSSLFEAFEGSIIYVSHDIDEALRFCDRIAVVDDGRILEVDSGDELGEQPAVRSRHSSSRAARTPHRSSRPTNRPYGHPSGAYASNATARSPMTCASWAYAPSTSNAPMGRASTAIACASTASATRVSSERALLGFLDRDSSCRTGRHPQ